MKNKRYKLKKDVKGARAGAIFTCNEHGDLWCPYGAEPITIKSNVFTLFPGLLEDWFEEIPEETGPCNVDSFTSIATSKLAKVEIADRDYMEGEQKYFTFDQALEIEKKLKPTGWRLPTRSEWTLICEEFGQKDECLNPSILANKLKLNRNGWYDFDDGVPYHVGNAGWYWSSTPNSDGSKAYYLYFDSSNVNPSSNVGRYFGLSLRFVRDTKEGE